MVFRYLGGGGILSYLKLKDSLNLYSLNHQLYNERAYFNYFLYLSRFKITTL